MPLVPSSALEPATGFAGALQLLLLEVFPDPVACAAAGRAPVVEYLVRKTRSADAGAKTRANYGNVYALAAICEHHLGLVDRGLNPEEHPARYVSLQALMRSKPYGSRLQNHPLNHRLNEEFCRLTRSLSGPVRRDVVAGSYWLDVAALVGSSGADGSALARWVVRAVDEYVSVRQSATSGLLARAADPSKVCELLTEMLSGSSDARSFEVASYVVLACWFSRQFVGINGVGRTLQLHRLGRTNANDGGVDFLLQPLGRVFQVTEDLSGEKLVSDLDKLGSVCVTFVVKSPLSPAEFAVVAGDALRSAGVDVSRVEEWVTLPVLFSKLAAVGDGASRQLASSLLVRELGRELG